MSLNFFSIYIIKTEIITVAHISKFEMQFNLMINQIDSYFLKVESHLRKLCFLDDGIGFCFYISFICLLRLHDSSS